MAIVIKKKGKNIPEATAMDYVLGYTTAHDVSARDWQFNKNANQWIIGKALDGFCPLGKIFRNQLFSWFTMGSWRVKRELN